MPWFHQRPNLLTMYGSLTPPPFQRRFTPLASAGMQYYTIPTWTASGDFEIEFSFYYSDMGTISILGSSASGDDRIFISSGELSGVIGGASLFAGRVAAPINELCIGSVRRVGVSVVLSVKGIDGATVATPNTLTIDRVGTNFFNNYFNGYIANVSLQTAGDNRLYKLDENFGETSVAVDSIGGNNGTAINIAESQLFTEVADGWEGVELWTQGVIVSNGAEGAFATLATETAGVVVGQVIRYEFDVNALTSGQGRLFTGDTLAEAVTANGVYTGDSSVTSFNSITVRVGNVQTNAGASFSVSAKQFLEVA